MNKKLFYILFFFSFSLLVLSSWYDTYGYEDKKEAESVECKDKKGNTIGYGSKCVTGSCKCIPNSCDKPSESEL